MDCWSKISTFQMALILLLIIAVPFFIAMIIVYIIFGLMSKDSELCNYLCCRHRLPEPTTPTNMRPSDMNKKIPTPRSPTGGLIVVDDPSDPDDVLVIANPNATDAGCNATNATAARYYRETAGIQNVNIAALLEDLYQDDQTEHLLKCAAVVMTKGWALATGNCVRSSTSLIRLDSLYWSKGGVVETIKEVYYSEDTTLILVQFQGRTVEKVPIAQLRDREKLQGLHWTNTLDMSLVNRRKYDLITSFAIEPYLNISCANFITRSVPCFVVEDKNRCGDKIEAPMVDTRGRLVGFHLETFCPEEENFAVVLYVDVNPFEDWIYSVTAN